MPVRETRFLTINDAMALITDALGLQGDEVAEHIRIDLLDLGEQGSRTEPGAFHAYCTAPP